MELVGECGVRGGGINRFHLNDRQERVRVMVKRAQAQRRRVVRLVFLKAVAPILEVLHPNKRYKRPPIRLCDLTLTAKSTSPAVEHLRW